MAQPPPQRVLPVGLVKSALASYGAPGLLSDQRPEAFAVSSRSATAANFFKCLHSSA